LIKLKKCWFNFRIGGEVAPIAPPLATCLSSSFLRLLKASGTVVIEASQASPKYHFLLLTL